MNRFYPSSLADDNTVEPISYKYAFTNQILSTIGNTAIHHYVIEIAKGGKPIITLTTKGKHKLGNFYPSAIFTSYSNSILERFVIKCNGMFIYTSTIN